MDLKERIKEDLIKSNHEKNNEYKNSLRVIVGELERQNKKDLNDIEVIKILKQLEAGEKEVLKFKNSETSNLIITLNKYIPKQANEEEIKHWIKNNIDFSKYKNKMQSMKDIMNNFAGMADGNVVKKIIEQI